MIEQPTQEPIRLEFELKKDRYISGRTFGERRMPLFLVEGNAPLVSYWGWDGATVRYVPRSSIQWHVDLGFLATGILAEMQRVLRDPNVFHDFNGVAKSAKVRKKGNLVIYVAEITSERVAKVQAQYLEMGSINAYQFLFGLEIPERKGNQPRRLREGMQYKLKRALETEHHVRATIRDGQPWYTPTQQAEILKLLGAVYVPRITEREGDCGDGLCRFAGERKPFVIGRER